MKKDCLMLLKKGKKTDIEINNSNKTLICTPTNSKETKVSIYTNIYGTTCKYIIINIIETYLYFYLNSWKVRKKRSRVLR